jgi:hypothetical protein
MSSLGDTMSYGIAVFVLFLSFTLALFQNIGVMDSNNHFMGTSPTYGYNDTQVRELVNSTDKPVSSVSGSVGLVEMGMLLITTIIGGLYNAVIGLSSWMTQFYVPPVMALGLQIAIDANFAYDLYILWRSN